MYCSNCGKEVDKNAVICIHCGCALNNNTHVKKGNGHGKGIASMVLGIIGIFFSLAAFGNLDDLSYVLYDDAGYKFGYALGTILIQTILAIIAICLSVSERKTEKNGFNTAGFWLSIAIFALDAIQFISIIAY